MLAGLAGSHEVIKAPKVVPYDHDEHNPLLAINPLVAIMMSGRFDGKRKEALLRAVTAELRRQGLNVLVVRWLEPCAYVYCRPACFCCVIRQHLPACK